MRLILDPGDLRPEFQKGKGAAMNQAIYTSAVTFTHLNDKAQEAVRRVLCCTYQNWRCDEQVTITAP